MAPVNFAQSLKVMLAEACENGVQYYVIFADKGSRLHELKRVRYSDITTFNDVVRLDVPDFSAPLPRKTFRRHTDAEFLERRRAGIEVYLRTAAANPRVLVSRGFKAFFRDAERLLEFTDGADDETPKLKCDVNDQADSDSKHALTNAAVDVVTPELLQGSVGEALAGELAAKSLSAKSVAELAAARHSEVLLTFSSGEAAAAHANAEVEAQLCTTADEATRLRSHDAEMQALLRECRARVEESSERIALQAALAKRAQSELDAAEKSCLISRAAVEQARQALDAQVTKSSAADAHAEHTAKHAETQIALAVATERRDAAMALVTELRARAEVLDAKREAALRAHASKKKIASSAAEDVEAAQQMREQSARKARESAAALSAHTKEATQRLKSLDAALARARDQADVMERLRDSRSREQLGSADREAFTAAQREVSEAATRASQVLAEAKAARDDASVDDKEVFLKAEAKATAVDLAHRSKLVDEFETRLTPLQHTVNMAAMTHAVASQVAAATHDELRTAEAQLEELDKHLRDCAAKATNCASEVDDARAASSAAVKAARREVEVEELTLAHKEAAKSTLEQALAKALCLGAEAEGDKMFWSDDVFDLPSKAMTPRARDEQVSEFEKVPMPSAKALALAEQKLVQKHLEANSEVETKLRAVASEQAAAWAQDRPTKKADLCQAEVDMKLSAEDRNNVNKIITSYIAPR